MIDRGAPDFGQAVALARRERAMAGGVQATASRRRAVLGLVIAGIAVISAAGVHAGASRASLDAATDGPIARTREVDVMKSKVAVVGAVMVAVAATANAQNLIINGGFELGGRQGDCVWVLYNAGSTDIPGWMVAAGNIDRQRIAANCSSSNEGWISYDGEYTIDLNGSGPGSLRQSLSVIPNKPTRLSFMLTGNCSASMAGLTRSVRVEVAGLSQTFEFVCTAGYPQPWVPCVMDFTPDTSVISLAFTSLTPNTTLGPVIDAVSVIQIPIACPADIVPDRFVGGSDLAALLTAWGTNGGDVPRADTNGDGIVDGSDLATVLGAWGPCG